MLCLRVGRPSRGPRLTEESGRTVWPSAKSSCLSRFITSTTQQCDLCGWTCGYFHVINKDSFLGLSGACPRPGPPAAPGSHGPAATTGGQRPRRWWAARSASMWGCSNRGSLRRETTRRSEGEIAPQPPWHLLTFKTRGLIIHPPGLSDHQRLTPLRPLPPSLTSPLSFWPEETVASCSSPRDCSALQRPCSRQRATGEQLHLEPREPGTRWGSPGPPQLCPNCVRSQSSETRGITVLTGQWDCAFGGPHRGDSAGGH